MKGLIMSLFITTLTCYDVQYMSINIIFYVKKDFGRKTHKMDKNDKILKYNLPYVKKYIYKISLIDKFILCVYVYVLFWPSEAM